MRFSPDSGTPVVLNFWASWCPPCREESPLLERTWRQYEGRGVLFVGVDTQDTEVDARAYIEEFGLSFPNGLDADGEITVAYGVVGLPVTFFIGSDGVVKSRWVGALTESQLLPWVEELAAGRAVARRRGPTAAVRHLGRCGIIVPTRLTQNEITEMEWERVPSSRGRA